MGKGMISMALDLGFIAAVYFGIYGGNVVAGNIAIFCAWFLGLLSLTVALYSASDKSHHAELLAARTWWRYAAWIVDIVAIVMMAGGGWFWTVSAYAFGHLLYYSQLFKNDKEQAHG